MQEIKQLKIQIQTQRLRALIASDKPRAAQCRLFLTVLRIDRIDCLMANKIKSCLKTKLLLCINISY